MKMLDLEWSTTIHLVMILGGFFYGSDKGNHSLHSYSVCTWMIEEHFILNGFLLLYADDIVTVPEAWNMAYFCLKIIVSGGNLL